MGTVSGLTELLRPRKVRNALRRRWFEAWMRRVVVTPDSSLLHLGTDYGGWHVPDDLIDDTWTCYCVGAGSDVSFDLALIERYGARVRCFDPYAVFQRQAEQLAGDDPRFSFHLAAIAPQDGPLTMYGRQDLEQGAVSAANLYRVDTAFERPGRSLPSIMRELGDERIDLLKLDVEGIEYDVLGRLDLAELGVRVLCVELHHTASVSEARHLLVRLGAGGLTVVHRKAPTNFTLVRS